MNTNPAQPHRHRRRDVADRSAPRSSPFHALQWGRRFLKSYQAAGPTPDSSIYANVDEAARLWPRNPACYAASIDLTCISPYNSRFGHYAAGTLVTPRHIWQDEHDVISIGDTVWFAQPDGTSTTRTVTAIPYLTSTGLAPGPSDSAILELDSPLPPEFKPARFVPPKLLPYLGLRLEAFAYFQPNAAKVLGDFYPAIPDGNYHASKQLLIRFATATATRPPAYSTQLSLPYPNPDPYNDFITGDSGNQPLVDVGDGNAPIFIGRHPLPNLFGNSQYAAALELIIGERFAYV